jgi:hypothetical protein
MLIEPTGSDHRSLLANTLVPVVPVWAGQPGTAAEPKVPDFSIRLANSVALV